MNTLNGIHYTKQPHTLKDLKITSPIAEEDDSLDAEPIDNVDNDSKPGFKADYTGSANQARHILPWKSRVRNTQAPSTHNMDLDYYE